VQLVGDNSVVHTVYSTEQYW